MKVSVVIPTHNRASMITGAIESVLAQSMSDLEIIVVDDGSSDGTFEALAPYRDRIVYLRQPNGGVSRARNTGMQAAQGEYIAWLDSTTKQMRVEQDAQIDKDNQVRPLGDRWVEY